MCRVLLTRIAAVDDLIFHTESSNLQIAYPNPKGNLEFQQSGLAQSLMLFCACLIEGFFPRFGKIQLNEGRFAGQVTSGGDRTEPELTKAFYALHNRFFATFPSATLNPLAAASLTLYKRVFAHTTVGIAQEPRALSHTLHILAFDHVILGIALGPLTVSCTPILVLAVDRKKMRKDH